MPLPKTEGRYIAVPKSWKVGEYNSAPIFEVLFQLLQFQDPQAGWTGVSGDMEITKRFFLKKTDGSWSEHSITSIMESLGWDGKSLKSLAEGTWSQVEVQLTIEYETKGDKTYIGVSFMNHRDYEGRKLSSDPTVVQSLDAKYGADLRNLSKTISPAKSPSTPTAPKTPTPTDAKSSAWREFVDKTPSLSKDERTAAWFETVKGYSGKDAKSLISADWTNVANSIAEFGPWKAPADAAPDSDPSPTAEPVAVLPEDDLPF